MIDSYIYAIVALLPIAASLVIFQANPFHALVMRGILGAIAALVYTVLGAADVALTEALVGTLLSVMLYAIAVRSSLILRLGVLKDELATAPDVAAHQPVIEQIRQVFSKYYLRLELVPYISQEELIQALVEKEVHVTCEPLEPAETGELPVTSALPPYQLTTRLPYLYQILDQKLAGSGLELKHLDYQQLSFSQSSQEK